MGTEVNLVNRLAVENQDKTVLDLHYSLCPNMFKINPKNLLWTLENIGKVNIVAVPETQKADALAALDRMLKLSPSSASQYIDPVKELPVPFHGDTPVGPNDEVRP
jgi:quinolinate synthase